MHVQTRGEVVARIVQRANLEEFADRVLDSFWDRPEFQQGHPPRDGVRAWVRWNLDPANFGRGARFAWGALLEAATDDERPALLDGADLLFEYVDRVSRIFSEVYEEASRSAPASSEEKLSRALLRRVVADEVPSAEDHQLAERIGFKLERAARPFVIALPGRAAADYLEVAARGARPHARPAGGAQLRAGPDGRGIGGASQYPARPYRAHLGDDRYRPRWRRRSRHGLAGVAAAPRFDIRASCLTFVLSLD